MVVAACGSSTEVVASGSPTEVAATPVVDDYRVIPATGARRMWHNGNGYCGECSLQIAGISKGMWVSQHQARRLAGGEALIGVNYGRMLSALHLQYAYYSDGGTGAGNRRAFLQWIRDGMVADEPVIFCVKTHDYWGGDPEYDHIITAHCVRGGATGYSGSDVLRYSDDFDGLECAMTFDEWCRGYANPEQYYYLPEEAQYGTRITGMDGDDETLPISLTVLSAREPNVTRGKSSKSMSAVVNMSDLTAGSTYSLLRWDATAATLDSVPFVDLLQSATPLNVEYEFVADGTTETRGVSFPSNGITIFRLVAGAVSGD